MKNWIKFSLLALAMCVASNLQSADKIRVYRQNMPKKTYTLNNGLVCKIADDFSKTTPKFSKTKQLFLAPKVWNPRKRGSAEQQGDLKLVYFNRRHRLQSVPVCIDRSMLKKVATYEGPEEVTTKAGGWFTSGEAMTMYKLSDASQWLISEPEAIEVGSHVVVCQCFNRPDWIMINLDKKVPTRGGVIYHSQNITPYIPLDEGEQ